MMKTAGVYGSAGWVAGIVGVHPWQLAMADPKVWQEVLGSDSDTWQASPYMPGGGATPVDGGYMVSVAMASRSCFRVGHHCRSRTFFCSGEKNDSMPALSPCPDPSY